MIEKISQKILGKSDFKLSKQIPPSYIFFLGITFIFSILRGKIRGFGIRSKGHRLAIGKQVKLRMKSKLYVGSNVRIQEYVTIDALSRNGVILGDRVKIGDYSRLQCSGSFSDLGEGIVIGNDSSFAENTYFGAAGGVKIGDNVISGQSVRFHSENHNFTDLDKLIKNQGVNRKGISIGNNCWIGAGAVFLDGAVIGDGCVIAANSVVRGEFGANLILGGVPAKIIGGR